MSIWATTTVEETPQLKLMNWRVFEVASDDAPRRTRHFVGFNLTEGAGRVSSEIVSFDPHARRGMTRSGRVYELTGEPGYGSMDGMYTWSQWCRMNKITHTEDVTEEIMGGEVEAAQ